MKQNSRPEGEPLPDVTGDFALADDINIPIPAKATPSLYHVKCHTLNVLSRMFPDNLDDNLGTTDWLDFIDAHVHIGMVAVACTTKQRKPNSSESKVFNHY